MQVLSSPTRLTTRASQFSPARPSVLSVGSPANGLYDASFGGKIKRVIEYKTNIVSFEKRNESEISEALKIMAFIDLYDSIPETDKNMVKSNELYLEAIVLKSFLP